MNTPDALQLAVLALGPTATDGGQQVSALPKSLTRWCCQGKSCGNTQLHITAEEPTVAPGEAPLPTLYTVRRLSNDEEYGISGATEAAVLAWIEETKGQVNP